MKRVTGLGGIFFKCRDRENTRNWYERHLGIPMEEWGALFMWRDRDQPELENYSLLSFFKRDTTYFDPSGQPFMINLRVDDLDALLPLLRQEGVELVGEPTANEFGKFAWVLDPEGNKIELWEQPR